MREKQPSSAVILIVGVCSVVHSATTHSDLMLRAKEMDVRVDVVHNASIMSAVGICGLQVRTSR